MNDGSKAAMSLSDDRRQGTTRKKPVNSLGVQIRTQDEQEERTRKEERSVGKGKGMQKHPSPAGRSTSPDDPRKKIPSSHKGKRKVTEPLEQTSDMWEIQVRPPAEETTPEPITKGSNNKGKKKIVATHSEATITGPQDIVDAGRHLNPSKKTLSAWFILTPSIDQNGKESLQPLHEPHLNIIIERDAQANVSMLANYIAAQLQLGSQDEVAIFMNGNLLESEMDLLDVVKQWAGFIGSRKKTYMIGSSAEHFCTKLTYARKE